MNQRDGVVFPNMGRLMGRRNIIKILQGGVNPDQLSRMQQGMVPGHENGAFASQHLTSQTLQALAALLSQGQNGVYQLPGQAQIPNFQYQPQAPAPGGRFGNPGLHLGQLGQQPGHQHFLPGGGGGPMLPPGLGQPPFGMGAHPQHPLPGGGNGPIMGRGFAPPAPRPRGQQFYPLFMQRALGR